MECSRDRERSPVVWWQNPVATTTVVTRKHPYPLSVGAK